MELRPSSGHHLGFLWLGDLRISLGWSEKWVQTPVTAWGCVGGLPFCTLCLGSRLAGGVLGDGRG